MQPCWSTPGAAHLQQAAPSADSTARQLRPGAVRALSPIPSRAGCAHAGLRDAVAEGRLRSARGERGGVGRAEQLRSAERGVGQRSEPLLPPSGHSPSCSASWYRLVSKYSETSRACGHKAARAHTAALRPAGGSAPGGETALRDARCEQRTSRAWRRKVLFSDLAHSMHSKHRSTLREQKEQR